MTTFTIGKHRMRNGETADVAWHEPNRVLGYIDGQPEKVWWTSDGRMWGNINGSPYDLLPPSPPKLEPVVDWVVRNCDGDVIRECISLNQADHCRARYTDGGARPPYTVHKRTTEQVEG